jgi:hypothetical protein
MVFSISLTVNAPSKNFSFPVVLAMGIGDWERACVAVWWDKMVGVH